jgi:hypothetical protein
MPGYATAMTLFYCCHPPSSQISKRETHCSEFFSRVQFFTKKGYIGLIGEKLSAQNSMQPPLKMAKKLESD